jgi:hypothetical protein
VRLGVLIAVLACAQPALAETKADTLFKKGKKLLAEKKYAEACAAFEKVDGLDPGIGAKLNVAKCFEEWGKLAKAYRWYEDAAKMATSTSDKRAGKIKELVDALDPDVPRLTIKLPDGVDAAGIKVTLDGAPFDTSTFGKEQRVDPGPHVIDYKAGDGKKTKTVPLERGGTTEVTLEVPKRKLEPKVEPKVEPKEPIEQPIPAATQPSNTRKIVGIGATGAGVIALGVSGYLALDARSKYNDALSTHCSGAKNMCDDEGIKLTADSRSRANTATVIAVVGAVFVTAGVVLWVTAPKQESNAHALYVAPSIGRDGGGIVFGGGF